MTQFNQMTELWIFVAWRNRFEPQKLAPLVNSESDVNYDFAVKHDPIQSDE